MVVSSSLNQEVGELLEKQLSEETHIGAQVCAYKDGNKIVDKCVGKLHPERIDLVQANTLFLSFSVTKGVAATAIHMLADRGDIEFEAPISKYWPEFGVNGKARITIKQALNHQAGLNRLPQPFDIELLADWEKGLRLIEQARPAWKPGTATAYHSVSFGWIVGGLIEKVTGKSVQEFVSEEIARPLGVLDEMYIGRPEGKENRIAWIDNTKYLSNFMDIPTDSEVYITFAPERLKYVNDLRYTRAPLLSTLGFFSARALAKMYAALLGDGSIDGVRLISKKHLMKLYLETTRDVDRLADRPVPRSIGFILGDVIDGKYGEFGPRETAFGHSGMGGSVAFADPEVGLSIAITLNVMLAEEHGTGRAFEICELIRASI
jgi:CubicO group peptidase (beta-lactamase class C family)